MTIKPYIKIAHTADIHVRPNAYLDEMEYTFDQFFESIIEQKVDLTVIAGDFFHSKLTVSSEYFRIAHRFFKRLGDICPFVIIPGNHDSALTNQGRLDAITPAIESIGTTKFPWKYSTKSESFTVTFPTPMLNDSIVFHHFSILDEKGKWPKKEDLDPTRINIALYHGAINDCIVDNGWTSRGNKDDLSIFEGFDYALLGDIHKTQFLGENKRVAYPGSLRQNNFGEDVDKGYLLWNIESKKEFNVQRMVLDQKRYFFTFHLSSIQDLPAIGDLPLDCRIRVKLVKNIDLAEEIKIKEEIISKYKPSGDVLFIPPEEDVTAQVNATKIGNLDIIHDNIRDFEVQKQLLKEYLTKKGVEESKIDEIVALDKKYHSYIDTDVLRNIIYDIKRLKWDNFLAYGKDNEINFDKLNGLIGIFGPNGTGKSSIFDAFSFVMQNSIYREGANKNGDYVNRKCKRSDIKMELELNKKKYVIERGIKKNYIKEGEEPKVENSVNFYKMPKSEENSLNGETTPETNKFIRDIFGNKEDQELTSFCPQFGLNGFIDSRGTKRKEGLAKFFDLGVFDTKFDAALKDHKDIKGRLKDCNKTELLKQVDLYRTELVELHLSKAEAEQQIATYEDVLADYDIELLEYTSKIAPVETFLKTIETYVAAVDRSKKEIALIESEIDTAVEMIAEMEKVSKELYPSVADTDKKKAKLPVLQKQASLIKTIPNQDVCRTCDLAKHAYEAKDKYEELAVQVTAGEKLVQMYLQTDTYLQKIHRLKFARNVLEESQGRIDRILATEDVVKRNKELQDKINETSESKKSCVSISAKLRNELMKTVSSIGSATAKLQIAEDKIKLEEELIKKDEVYSIYLDAMGKNGISYWIITKKLTLINKLVNQILSHAVPFKFSIEDNEEEKSIKLYVSDEKGKRPAEMCSGGEKTIVALALRAALWKVCLLPKTPILMLDESLGSLDQERHDSVMKLLKHLRDEYFDKIFIVTHNEELKRMMDNVIYIEKRKGFSYVEVK
jgi:DNA repair exonuclease SbcCD ATPase subunit/DNA repair exonuclease SbcCD nuclease subunit